MRFALRSRVTTAFVELAAEVGADRIVAIGHCFGGLEAVPLFIEDGVAEDGLLEALAEHEDALIDVAGTTELAHDAD